MEKNKKIVSVSLSRELLIKLDNYHEKTGNKSKSKTFESLLTTALNEERKNERR